MLNTAAAATSRNPVPARLYAQGELLYVHTGADYQVLARVGNFGKVAVSKGYPTGAFPAKDMSWAHDVGRVAEYMAMATNAYPTLRKQVAVLEAQKADLVAKLKLAEEALKRREQLTPEYGAALLAEMRHSIEKAS